MLYVESIDGSVQEPLNKKAFRSFAIKQSISGELSLSFVTIKGDNNPGHELLEPQAKVHIDGYDFTIKNFSENTYTKTVTALSTLFELKTNQVRGKIEGNVSLRQRAEFALANTGWILLFDPNIENITTSIEDFGDENSISLLEKIKEAYSVEYQIRPNNVIYFAREVGPDNDYVYRYRHNINEVVLVEDSTNLTTTIEGFGAGSLRERYTSPNVNVFGVLEAPVFRDERYTVRENLIDKLKSLVQDVPTLAISSNVPELNQRTIGERVWLNYEPLGINMKVRIVEQTLTLKNDELVSTNVILGNTIYDGLKNTVVKQIKAIADANKSIQDARDDYNQKIGEAVNALEMQIQVAANGKNTVFYSVTEPPIESAIDGDLWYQPDGLGDTKLYIFENNQWNPVADTADVTRVAQEVQQAVQEAQDALQVANNSAQEAQNAFDRAQEALEREFRPRNLLRNTNTKNIAATGVGTSVYYNDLGNGFYSAVATNTNTSSTWGVASDSVSRLTNLVNGMNYTLSFKAKSSEPIQLNYIATLSSVGNFALHPFGEDLQTTTEFKEFKINFTYGLSTNSLNGIRIGNNTARNANVSLEIKDIALYEGEATYGWLPAPEDVGYSISQVIVRNDLLATRVADNEGNISTLVQTSEGLFSRVENISTSLNNNLLQGTDKTTIFTNTGTINREFVVTPYDVAPIIDKYGLVEYVVSFDMKLPVTGGIQVYLQTSNGMGSKYSFLQYFNVTNTDWNRYSFVVTPTANTTSINQAMISFFATYGSGRVAQVRALKFELGNRTPAEWTPSKDDAFSQISQLNNNINLKVDKNDVVNQINISTEGILIAGNKVRITGQTVIDDAAIQSAKIASLDAAKITAGTLNAANVNIINLNASNITTGTLNVDRLGGGQIVGNTLRTSSDTNDYLTMQNQWLDFYNDAQRKLRIGFAYDGGYNNYFPYMEFGAGDAQGLNKGRIRKNDTGFYYNLSIPSGANRYSNFDMLTDGDVYLEAYRNLILGGNKITIDSSVVNNGYVKSRTEGLEITRSTTQPSRLVVRVNGVDIGMINTVTS